MVSIRALSGQSHHRAAATCLDVIEESDEVVWCRSTQQSFLRLLTTAAVFAPFVEEPLSNEEAWAVADAFLADPRFHLADVEPPGAAAVWRGYTALPSSSTKVWMDAWLSALARCFDARLVTNDVAFQSYPDLEPIPIGH